MSKLNELLSRPAEAFVPPPVLPVGTYDFVISKHEFGESSQKKTPYVRYHLRPTAPHEDVDQEALTAYGPFNKDMRLDFYLTEDALFRLREFHEKLELNTKLPLNELIPSAVNVGVTAAVSHRNGNDNRPYAEISQIVGLVK